MGLEDLFQCKQMLHFLGRHAGQCVRGSSVAPGASGLAQHIDVSLLPYIEVSSSLLREEYVDLFTSRDDGSVTWGWRQQADGKKNQHTEQWAARKETCCWPSADESRPGPVVTTASFCEFSERRSKFLFDTKSPAPLVSVPQKSFEAGLRPCVLSAGKQESSQFLSLGWPS